MEKFKCETCGLETEHAETLDLHCCRLEEKRRADEIHQKQFYGMINEYAEENRELQEKLLDCIEGLWNQFGYECGPKKKIMRKGKHLGTYHPYRHDGGMYDLEEARHILLIHGRIEKYRKNGKMAWYKIKEKE